MSQALTTTQNHTLEFTEAQLKLITDTVAKGATPHELELFLYRCKKMGFDPLKAGQIHFVKYGTGAGAIVVGIDGFRARAHRSLKLRGIKRGVLRDDKGKCVGAWAEVYRSDWSEPARVEVSLEEYDAKRGPWQKMPETMIQKVAEAGALRMAFPDDLAGVYSEDEMDKQALAPPSVGPGRPEEGDGIQTAHPLLIEQGTYGGRKFSEIPRPELLEYLERREAAILKNPAKKPDWWDRFAIKAKEYLAMSEDMEEEEEKF